MKESCEQQQQSGELTVHLHQQLVQSVLLFTLTPKVPSSSLTPHRVDLVDEEDAGGVLPRHGEHVPDLWTRKPQSIILLYRYM